MIRIATPRRTVVHQHPARKTVATKDARQSLANRACPFVVARPQTHAITRMIVQHCQELASTAIQRKMPLEVHLPEIVGTLMLDTHPSLVLARLRLIDQTLPMQDGRNRAG